MLCAKVDIVYNNGTTSNIEYYFKNIIDEFSQLTMTGLASSLASAQNATVTVYFQNNSTGTTFTLVDSTNSIQRHFISLVVNLATGALSSLVGDNFCDSSCVCYQNECF